MKNKLEEIQELMSELTKFAPTYIQELGIADGNPTGFIRCLNPDHDDHNPSMSWYREGETYFCFSCGKALNIFFDSKYLRRQTDARKRIYFTKCVLHSTTLRDSVFTYRH
mgnify:CR=1 FL=1